MPAEDAQMPEPATVPERTAPADAFIIEAQQAFAAGNYARVRALCAPHVQRSDDAGAKARDFMRRIGIDPVQIVLIALCALIFAGVAWYYVFR